jgi:hypothetical protein
MMSALTPKADIRGYGWNVRFVPKADIAPAFLHRDQKSAHKFKRSGVLWRR